MRLHAALIGDLQSVMAAELKAAERAVTAGVRAATDGLKAELRGQIAAAGLGDRLARAWRGEVYPRSEPSIRAAGVVYSKAARIVRVHAEGAVIRSKRGLFLAIPTDVAGRQGDGRQRITPGGWERRTGLRLRFVYRRGAPSLLVADMRARGGRRGGFGRATVTALRTGHGLVTVVVFILVPQVRFRKRLDVQGAGKRWQARLPELVEQSWRTAT